MSVAIVQVTDTHYKRIEATVIDSDTVLNINSFRDSGIINIGIIKTDGEVARRVSIDLPKAAFEEVIRLYNKHRDTDRSEATLFVAERDVCAEQREKALGYDIQDLELSVRTRNVLTRLGMKTIGDLVALTRKDLLAAEGCGRAAIDEIVVGLGRFDLSLVALKRGRKPRLAEPAT